MLVLVVGAGSDDVVNSRVVARDEDTSERAVLDSTVLNIGVLVLLGIGIEVIDTGMLLDIGIGLETCAVL